jgi:hypothetical protein
VGTIGLPQVNDGKITGLPLVTAGNEIANVAQFLQPGRDTYTAAEVVRILLSKVEPTTVPRAMETACCSVTDSK